MTPIYRIIPYDEAHAASERGEMVEYRRAGGQAWHPFGLFNGSLQQCGYEFRVLDLKPDELVIEPGKEYRAHGGYKTRVYAINAGGENPIHGAYLKDNCWIALSWRASGRYLLVSESDFDLIAPWTDTTAPYDNWDNGSVPSWAMWQAMNANGTWYFFETEPETCENTHWTLPHEVFSASGAGRLPACHRPTNFTGTWQSSLQARPQ